MTSICCATHELETPALAVPPLDYVCDLLSWKSSAVSKSLSARTGAATRINAKRLASVLNDCAEAMWPKEFASALTPDVNATMQDARITPWELLQIGKMVARATGAKGIPAVSEDYDPEFPEDRYLVLTICINGDARRLAKARSEAARAIVQSVPVAKRRHYRVILDTPEH